MLPEKKIWVDEQRRQEQLEEYIRQEKMANFGYQKVPEEEKPLWVQRHFNAVAPYYDFMNTLLSFGVHRLWKRTAVKMMALKSGDQVIDVCGGTGDLALLAAKIIGPSGQAIIYDINRAMINAGRHKIATTTFDNRISYVQGDAEQIAFPDQSFNGAMVGFGIRNVTHLERAFKEMYRVLKPNGKMMCLEFSKPVSPMFRWLYDIYSFHVMPWLGEVITRNRQAYTHLPESIRLFPLPGELTRILKRIGFSDITYQRLTNGIAVIHLAFKA